MFTRKKEPRSFHLNQPTPPLERRRVVQRQQLKRVENRAHRGDSRLTMKSQLVAIVAAVLLVGCASFREAWNEPAGNEYEPEGFRWAAPDDDWDGSWPEERN